MTRESSDRIDLAGITSDGFDYALQVWVENYIIQDVGQLPPGLAGKDIRTVPGRSVRCPHCGFNVSSLVSHSKSSVSTVVSLDGSFSDEIIEATGRVILFWWHLFEKTPLMGRLIKSIDRSDHVQE
ncbi:MAG: hypothetical protein PHV74_07435 [Dehalococcoidia bacterium]|nr:hypothetical protein [Dehalococcoidia bacterium]